MIGKIVTGVFGCVFAALAAVGVIGLLVGRFDISILPNVIIVAGCSFLNFLMSFTWPAKVQE